MIKKEKFVVLDNIRSVFNVGSIFRTADALGVTKIFLCGCTPTPKDRFGRKRKDLAKVALGAEESVAWEYFESVEKLLLSFRRRPESISSVIASEAKQPRKLKMDPDLRRDDKRGIQIIALEQNQKSIDYKKVKAKYPTAIILGEEVHGLSQKILNLADIIAEIPMQGKKESLNVSVSFGVAGFRIFC